MFDPGAAEGLEARYALRLGEESFRAVVTDGRFDIVRGRADHPDATIKTGAATLEAPVYEGRPLDEALRSGDVRVEGDESTVERFLGLLPWPLPAA
jgi:ubiquinone biosynthesis protein UbiJ